MATKKRKKSARKRVKAYTRKSCKGKVHRVKSHLKRKPRKRRRR